MDKFDHPVFGGAVAALDPGSFHCDRCVMPAVTSIKAGCGHVSVLCARHAKAAVKAWRWAILVCDECGVPVENATFSAINIRSARG